MSADMAVRDRVRPKKRSMKQFGFLDDEKWLVARFTELLLTGHNIREVRDLMYLDIPASNELLRAAIKKVEDDRKAVEDRYARFGEIGEIM
jgi:hypothetical protein